MTAPGQPPVPEYRPEPFASTPNAERYLLQADDLRRRQLRSALLHGSTRTWRDRRRIWPAVVAGVVAVAVVIAAIAVHGAFRTYQEQQRLQEEERRRQFGAPPVTLLLPEAPSQAAAGALDELTVDRAGWSV